MAEMNIDSVMEELAATGVRDSPQWEANWRRQTYQIETRIEALTSKQEFCAEPVSWGDVAATFGSPEQFKVVLAALSENGLIGEIVAVEDTCVDLVWLLRDILTDDNPFDPDLVNKKAKIQTLIDAGADVNKVVGGETPLARLRRFGAVPKLGELMAWLESKGFTE